MAVVINEFEVVPENVPSTTSPPGTEGGIEPPTGPTPLDVSRILRREAERVARVRAD